MADDGFVSLFYPILPCGGVGWAHGANPVGSPVLWPVRRVAKYIPTKNCRLSDDGRTMGACCTESFCT